MSMLVSVAVVALVTLWLVVTVFSHVAPLRKWIRPITNYDICAAVPIWTFFAPNPGRTDVHLLYRDRDEFGKTTAWRNIVVERRSVWWSLWNPKRRIGKGMVDVTPDLVSNTQYEERAPVSKKKVLEFGYLLLLNYVCRQPADFRAQTRQFAVARTQGHRTEHKPEVIFLSAFHHLK